MIIIGITGGTGAGKTSVLGYLEGIGAHVIDCDAVYHSLLQSSQSLLKELNEAFPGTVVNGSLERKTLGALVFNDQAAMERLNQITHRYISLEVEAQLLAQREAGRKICAIDAIALLEGGIKDRCNFTVGVVAPRELRIERIMAREGISYDYAAMRVDAQKSNEYFIANCDYTIENDGSDYDMLLKKCKALFDKLLEDETMSEKTELDVMKEQLLYAPDNGWDRLKKEEHQALEAYCGRYMDFMNKAKTEREFVKETIKLAEARGFVPFEPGMSVRPGDKIYRNNRGKALTMAVIGSKDPAEGFNLVASHIDSPRLDLKPNPLYEDSEMGFFKTHYYGGIKKYQWTTVPLELRGVVALTDGRVIDVCYGADKSEPVLVITDLLIHLAGDQMKKSLAEGVTGENLNVLLGSKPVEGKGSDRVKLAIMKILNDKYGIVEQDFLSAELSLVPAFEARAVGIDGSFIGAYGHDDRVCAYAGLEALLETEKPERTAILTLADKEEIGSMGISGMESQEFDTFVEDICRSFNTLPGHCMRNSTCLSCDVTNAFDPTYAEVSDKRNDAKVNYGVAISKYTGSRGKSGSSDASAELMAKVRRILDDGEVIWQSAELGKVDQGGGGTVAMIMANRNISTVDMGVPVLSMHAPWEVVAKLDTYMNFKAAKAFYAR